MILVRNIPMASSSKKSLFLVCRKEEVTQKMVNMGTSAYIKTSNMQLMCFQVSFDYLFERLAVSLHSGIKYTGFKSFQLLL